MFEKFNFKLSALIAIYSAPTLKSAVKRGWKIRWNWKSDSQMSFWFSGEDRKKARVILLQGFCLFPFTNLVNSSTVSCTLFFFSTIKLQLYIPPKHFHWLFFLPYHQYIYITKKINENLYKCRILTTTLKGILWCIHCVNYINTLKSNCSATVNSGAQISLQKSFRLRGKLLLTMSVTEYNPTNTQIIKD